MDIQSKKLRNCFGCFATGVVIACTKKKARIFDNCFSRKGFDDKANDVCNHLSGITINSFSSLSLDPPLIQFAIGNKSSQLSFFKKNHYFSLNILSSEQQNLSNAFASSSKDLTKKLEKWQIEPFFLSKYSNPIFENSLAFIECKRYKVIKAGDHHIIIGKVVDFKIISNKNPLTYYRGNYATLT